MCGSVTCILVCVSSCASVQKKQNKNCSCRSGSSCGFGKAPRILCRQWQCSPTKLLWGCRYLCRTPAAKVIALSQILTVDSQPFMMPSVSWLSKEPCKLYYPCLERGGGGWGTEVTNHDKGLRDNTERDCDQALCAALLYSEDKVHLPLNSILCYSWKDWIILCVFQQSQNQKDS